MSDHKPEDALTLAVQALVSADIDTLVSVVGHADDKSSDDAEDDQTRQFWSTLYGAVYDLIDAKRKKEKEARRKRENLEEGPLAGRWGKYLRDSNDPSKRTPSGAFLAGARAAWQVVDYHGLINLDDHEDNSAYVEMKELLGGEHE